MNIVLTGAPGSGKDTLSDKLRDQYGFMVLNTGALYRQEALDGTEFGIKAKAYWGAGNLCPDEMTNELMNRTISHINNKENIIFNGYPRSVGQAQFLDTLIRVDINLHLRVEEYNAVNRLLKRGRLDDREDIIATRFQQYNLKTAPLLDYYEQFNKRFEVNANSSEQRVLTECLNLILHNVRIS